MADPEGVRGVCVCGGGVLEPPFEPKLSFSWGILRKVGHIIKSNPPLANLNTVSKNPESAPVRGILDWHDVHGVHALVYLRKKETQHPFSVDFKKTKLHRLTLPTTCLHGRIPP